MSFSDTLSRVIGEAELSLKAASPTVLVVGGIVAVGASVVLAARESLKFEETMEPHRANLETIEESLGKDLVDGGVYDEGDARHDRIVVFRQTAVSLVKLYGPSALVFAGGVAAILGGHHMMLARNAALVAAYKTLDSSYRAYRKNVQENYGDETDGSLRRGDKLVSTETVNEDGSISKDRVWVTDPNRPFSGYSRFFSRGETNCWEDDMQINRAFLDAQERFANSRLQARGHLFLNDVYEALGFPKTQEGTQVGWRYTGGDGDGYVTFGIDNVRPDYERNAFLLDFNVDGPIVGILGRNRDFVPEVTYVD